MTVTYEQLHSGVRDFVESEIAPKATGLTKFGVYMLLPSIHRYIAKFAEHPLAEEFKEDGQVDIDKLKHRALDAMDHCGCIEVMGFRLDRSDIESLFICIQRA